MDLGGLTSVCLAAALFILVARVIRTSPAGVDRRPGAAAQQEAPAPATRPAAREPILRYCGVCEARMGGTCARCDGPACLTCDHCFGCRLHVCDACDFEPTPPFWLPGDKAPHPHNTLHD